MKTIGILTSGGDAPGMNTAVWAAARAAHSKGMKILGIRHGYQGLMEEEIVELDVSNSDTMLNAGGTILKTARCKAMLTEEGRDTAVATIKKFGIEGLIVVGGDGSFKGANVIANRGVPTIGLPGTIDNDLAYTDYTIGFDTVCNTVVDAIMKIRDTMKSHNRVGVVQVMGRHCGDIALYAGLAAGADYVLVPEMADGYSEEYDFHNLMKHMDKMWAAKKHYGIIIIAEGVYWRRKNTAYQLRQRMEECSNYEVRETVLGYMQRGGTPTVFDRRLAVQSASRAVELLSDGIGNRAVGIRRNEIFDMDIEEALATPKYFDKAMYDLVNSTITSR